MYRKTLSRHLRTNADPFPGLGAVLIVLGYFAAPLPANAQCDQPPIAVNDVASSCGLPILIGVLENDWEPNGEAMTTSVVSVTGSGCASTSSVQVSYGMLVFTPDPGWGSCAIDSTCCQITYRVDDERVSWATASVQITASDPDLCALGIFADGFESGDTLQWSATEG